MLAGNLIYLIYSLIYLLEDICTTSYQEPLKKKLVFLKHVGLEEISSFMEICINVLNS